MTTYIHPLSEVQSLNIGKGSKIWQYVVVLPGAIIGADVNICAHCFIENAVSVGNRVTIKSGVYLWDGVRIEDDVFIGPNVTFTNDKFPRSKVYPESNLITVIEKGASIGAGAVLLPGITIGQGAMVGAGALVSGSVPPFAIVTGSPARIVGYVASASPLTQASQELRYVSNSTSKDVVKVGVGGVSLHQLKVASDMRGELSYGDFEKDIPFKVKRYFLVYNVPSEKTRGEHAHHDCKQFLICIKGSCTVVVDNSVSRSEVALNSPNLGLYIPPLIWGIQYKYSSDAVLLVFCSDLYDANDYIRSYSDYINLIQDAVK